jgi:hypothetical protein
MTRTVLQRPAAAVLFARRAAEELGFIAKGRAVVDVEVLRMGEGIR